MANERALENHASVLPTVDVDGLHGPVRIVAVPQTNVMETAHR